MQEPAPTLMRREIGEIPDVVRGILRDGADDAGRVADAIERMRPSVVVVTARGTSDHAGIYARYLVESHLRLPVALAANSLTTIYERPMAWAGALVLGISQSGEGPDVNGVLADARQAGALTVAITNEAGSSITAAAEHVLLCRAGRERSVAATKTYVAELTIVAQLVAELVSRRASASDADADELSATLARVPDALDASLVASERWLDTAEPLVEALAASDRALVVSRGYNAATAFEVALKLKETCGIFAEGYSAADLLHGPLALAAPSIPLLVFRPDGRMGEAIDETVARARAVGARPWIVAGSDPARAADATHGRRLALPVALPDALSPLPFVLPGQLLAERVARRRGMDPDAPRSLTKVTRTL